MRDSPAEVVIPELDAAASSVGASSVGPISVGAFSVGASVRAFSLEGLQGVCLELGGRVLGGRERDLEGGSSPCSRCSSSMSFWGVP